MSCKLLRVLRPKSGIYIVNKSTLVTDADVKRWTAACARQIAEHVAPAYDRKPVKVAFLSAASHAPAGAWVITVLDDADQAGDLGWHTEDASGRIYGRVFAQPCLQYGVPVSTTLSHEIVETFCDPDVDKWVDTGEGYSVAYEACDPVESWSYSVDGVEVSDFVTPGWYGVGKGRTHWLDSGVSLAPFALGSGGYYVRRWPDGHEDQDFGEQANRDYVKAKRHQLGRAQRRLEGVPSDVPRGGPQGDQMKNAKFIVALVTAALTGVAQVLPVGSTATQWVSFVLAVLGAVTVYLVPNTDPAARRR